MIGSDPAADPRFSRQISLDGVGSAGQAKLAASRVLVYGAGGLGSAILFNLAGGGIGHLTIVDPDRVDLTNLNRQYLYQVSDIGQPKAEAAARRLYAYRPEMVIESIHSEPSVQLTADLVSRHDLVVSAVDNRQARMLLNAACCRVGRPLIDGGVNGFSGYLAVIIPGQTPCFCCLFADSGRDDPPLQNRQPAAVLGSIASVVGSLQATATLLLVLEPCSPLGDDVLYIDGRSLCFDRVRFVKDPHCAHCSGVPRPGST